MTSRGFVIVVVHQLTSYVHHSSILSLLRDCFKSFYFQIFSDSFFFSPTRVFPRHVTPVRQSRCSHSRQAARVTVDQSIARVWDFLHHFPTLGCTRWFWPLIVVFPLFPIGRPFVNLNIDPQSRPCLAHTSWCVTNGAKLDHLSLAAWVECLVEAITFFSTAYSCTLSLNASAIKIDHSQ